MLSLSKNIKTWMPFRRMKFGENINNHCPILDAQPFFRFCDNSKDRSTSNNVDALSSQKNIKLTPNVQTKYEAFTDENATVILDIEEERDKILNEAQPKSANQEKLNISRGLKLERGKTGVFDIDELIDVLKRDNAENIFVCSIPHELKYVDYFCIVSGRSNRHMEAMAEFVRKMYKIKRASGDIIPKIEGKNSGEWIAMDLGNIALHIFSSKTREKYDLEQLWALGPEYDEETNKKEDSILELFNKHSLVLGSEPSNKRNE